MTSSLSRAQGCLVGQCVGDALGSLVEFQSPQQILQQYPSGVRDLHDGGRWDTLAGQPTDDSELALSLAHTIIEQGDYRAEAAFQEYLEWYESNPFDCGLTIRAALQGMPNLDSESNGALMRASPLGIFGSNKPLDKVAAWANQDANLTHPNTICCQVNELFVMAIAIAIKEEISNRDLYQHIEDWAKELWIADELMSIIRSSAHHPPPDYLSHQGWVLVAFGNTLWQLTHADDFESGVVDTIMQGGDTDTNAAIAGALLGAVYGLEAIPSRWVDCILNCRPKAGLPEVHQPRSEKYWPVDVLKIAESLLLT